MPKPLKWKKLTPTGKEPEPRIGHSLLKVDRQFVMFGGLVMKEDRSKVIPTNDIYTLKLGGKNI